MPVKSHDETIWSSTKYAITSLWIQIKDIYVLLQRILNVSSNNNETISVAKKPLVQIYTKYFGISHV